jgi:hypothetical protein
MAIQRLSKAGLRQLAGVFRFAGLCCAIARLPTPTLANLRANPNKIIMLLGVPLRLVSHVTVRLLPNLGACIRWATLARFEQIQELT